MKVYVVVVIFHPGNAPNNYSTSCKVFTSKKDALDYQAQKRNEYPITWSGDYNHVELFEKSIK